MSDPPAKRWLADDPHFIARLGDLDDELIADGDDAHRDPIPSSSAPIAARSPSARASTRLAPAPAPWPGAPPSLPLAGSEPLPAVDDPASAPPLALARFSPAGELHGRRPLLDLFPPPPLEAQGHPPLTLGTAVGPELPPRPPESAATSPRDTLTYEIFYGFHEKPFGPSTDPKFLYQSGSHERAGQELLSAIGARSGVAILTGPLGIGKTILCRSLVEAIDRGTVASLVLEPTASLDDLLTTMLIDFGVVSRDDLARAPGIARPRQIAALRAFVDSLAPLKASAVVIIDEAQRLSIEALESLVGLTAPGSGAGLQFVLVGQPALATLLERPELRALHAAITVRIALGPLDHDAIGGYVARRIAVAAVNPRVSFDEAALARIYDMSRGVPGIVNLLCDRALIAGHSRSASVIDVSLVAGAAAALHLGGPPLDARAVARASITIAAFVVLIFAGASGAMWVYRDAVARTIVQWENVPQPPDRPILRVPAPLPPTPPPADLPDDAPNDAPNDAPP